MIGRNFIAKNAKNFSEHNAKKFTEKLYTVTEKSKKKTEMNSLRYDDNGHVFSKSKSV